MCRWRRPNPSFVARFAEIMIRLVESDHDLISLFEHDLLRKTGTHPASSAGQAFSGSCSSEAAYRFRIKQGSV
jgi:hypothetical protein